MADMSWVWKPHAIGCFCNQCYWRRYRDKVFGDVKLAAPKPGTNVPNEGTESQ